MRKIFLVGSVMLLGFGAYAQTTVKGFVYNDVNANGKLDKAEKGIAAVAVTNGSEVVLTNDKGAYELPIGNDQIISVIKPAGYKVPLNADNLPQFFYNHKPNGSPALKYKGVAPTGALPKSVDFFLTAVKEDPNFTALIFGDPQPYTQEEVDFFEKDIVDEVVGRVGALGAQTHDVLGHRGAGKASQSRRKKQFFHVDSLPFGLVIPSIPIGN